jgi:glucosylceramidase
MIKTVLTAKDTSHRLSVVDGLFVPYDADAPLLQIDRQTRFQTVIGFGGAFTESACYNLYRVAPEVRERAIRMYFDPDEGIGYTIGRVSIHGCDFSLSSYVYVEEGDVDLKTFDIARDRRYVVPVVLRAEAIAGRRIELLGSPWTPPAFMKDNGSLIHGGHLLEKYADAWARYYVRFVEEYRKAGLTIRWLSVQNEPQAVQRWDSCIYSGEQERDFVRDHLGPTLKDSVAKDVELLVWDHNRDVMFEHVKPIMDDPQATQYVWGTAFHWYVSEAFENVGKTHAAYPDKHLMFTEGCVENFHMHRAKWESGERYARNIIGDFSNWCEGWMDWNLWLDNLGGPNHVNNVCDAPLIIDVFPETIVPEASYYYIGHFSKFVRPGAVRIRHSGGSPILSQIAFENPDGSLVVVVMNPTEHAVTFNVDIQGAPRTLRIPPRAIATVLGAE